MTVINYPMGFPKKAPSWKGNTLYQIIASIQFNKMSPVQIAPADLLRPLPLKIYRKEINNTNSSSRTATCSVRPSTSITGLDMPGSTIITSVDRSYNNGLVNILSLETTTLTAENGLCDTTSACFLSPSENARRRVRSAGMISRKFNLNRNNDHYYTSTKEYLVSRNRTIEQNQYKFFKQSNIGLLPNNSNSKTNIFRPQGLSHCSRPSISASIGNNRFSYIWIDGTSNTVTIPDGIYDIESLNIVLQDTMMQNTHYFIVGGVKVFLILFSYDTSTDSIVIVCNPASQNANNQSYFTINNMPPSATWTYNDNVPLIEPYDAFGEGELKPYPLGPTQRGSTYVEIPDSIFADLMGFYPGVYTGGINQSFFQGTIYSKYVTLYHKPNNQTFGTQGAVDSSTYIHRAKYVAITNYAKTLKSAYGDAVANALAYGVSEQAYTIKDKIGFKKTAVPVIDANGNICPNPNFIYRSR
jgi:hypothetical protein